MSDPAKPGPRPGPPPSAARVAVMIRYARLSSTGKTMTCGPQYGARKVIFDTEEAAIAAAAELRTLGARPQEAYPCGRSKRGHYHLTTIEEKGPPDA